MREISCEEISAAAEMLCIRAASFLTPDLAMQLECASESEPNPAGRGALEATLYAYRNNLPTGETLTLNGARFDFTLPLNAGAQDGAAPAFTLPPDYAKV